MIIINSTGKKKKEAVLKNKHTCLHFDKPAGRQAG
jgi:hypothetical protein